MGSSRSSISLSTVLCIEVRLDLWSPDIVAIREELIAICGAPAHTRTQDHPAMISKAVTTRCGASASGGEHL
jgi:hypothetical protein